MALAPCQECKHKISAVATAMHAVLCLFVVSSASADDFGYVDIEEDTGRFVWLRGQVIQSIQSGDNYVLRVNLTRGDHGIWTDTVLVTYTTVSRLQPSIREKAVVQFQGASWQDQLQNTSWRYDKIATRECLPTVG